MNHEQFQALNTIKASPRVVGAGDLIDKTPRTLLFGYTCSRNTWHVYLDERSQIHVLSHSFNHLLLSHTAGPQGGVSTNGGYVLDKRLYAESCDFEFCRLLAKEGVHLPFTTFNAANEAARTQETGFAGLRLENLQAVRLLDRNALGIEISQEQANAVLTQAARELGTIYESGLEGVVLPTATAPAVLARAQELSMSPRFLATKERLSLPRVEKALPGFAHWGVHSLGGLLSGSYHLENEPSEQKLKRAGYTVSRPAPSVLRLQKGGEDIVLVGTTGPDGLVAESGFFVEYLFGHVDAFEKALQPYFAFKTPVPEKSQDRK